MATEFILRIYGVNSTAPSSPSYTSSAPSPSGAVHTRTIPRANLTTLASNIATFQDDGHGLVDVQVSLFLSKKKNLLIYKLYIIFKKTPPQSNFIPHIHD